MQRRQQTGVEEEKDESFERYSNQAGRNFEERCCWICENDDPEVRKCSKCSARRMVIGPRTVRRTSEIRNRLRRGRRKTGRRGSGAASGDQKKGSDIFLTTHIYTNSDVHNALCNEEKACLSLCVCDLSDGHSDKCLMMYERKECLNTHFPYGLAVRISGFHPGGSWGSRGLMDRALNL